MILQKNVTTNTIINKIQPPDPHSKKQQFLFSCLSIPGIKEIWCCSGTKFGKTISGAVAQINKALECSQGSVHRWVAPIYSQTLPAMDYFRKILPPEPYRKINKSDNSIVLPNSDTRFEFWHAQKPESLEGAAIRSYVFDEAARQPASIRYSARTTTTRTKGPMLFISYPYGKKNWFWDGCNEARDHMMWSAKNGKQYEKIFVHARTIDNPHIDQAVIDQAKKDLPDRLYRQYYLAEATDEGSIFTIGSIVYGELLDVTGERQTWSAKNCEAANVVIGIDWAKTVDYTVMTAADLSTKKIIAFDRFHKMPYTAQIKRLAAFAKQFKSVEMIIHDKTGVGQAIDDQLCYINQPFHGVTFTNQLKNELITNLMTAIEHEQILIPNWPEAKRELEEYELNVSSTGLPIYGAPSGKHDDIVMSIVLVNYGLMRYSGQSFEVNYLEDIRANQALDKNELLEWYLSDDDD
jgi:hypothetical protein